MQMGLDSKIRGVHSMKIQENLQKLKAHGSMAQPTDLMDPDQTNAPGALD